MDNNNNKTSTCTWSDICCTDLPEGYVIPAGADTWISCHLDLAGPAISPDNYCPEHYGFYAHAFWHSACYSNRLNIFGNYKHTWHHPNEGQTDKDGWILSTLNTCSSNSSFCPTPYEVCGSPKMNSCQSVNYHCIFQYSSISELSCPAGWHSNPSHEAGYQQCIKSTEWYRNDGSVRRNNEEEPGGFCKSDRQALVHCIFFLLFCISVYVIKTKAGQKRNYAKISMGSIILVWIWTMIPYVGGTIFLIGAFCLAISMCLYLRHLRRVKKARTFTETSIEMSQNIITNNQLPISQIASTPQTLVGTIIVDDSSRLPSHEVGEVAMTKQLNNNQYLIAKA